ncbi:hypothetical protein L581_1786 [Serratia fonticola AU-AP2C]|nr:hypothetical protein L581_1786 [Serratia fonticola AU-AP2C]
MFTFSANQREWHQAALPTAKYPAAPIWANAAPKVPSL